MLWHRPRACSCRETGIRDRRGIICWILSTSANPYMTMPTLCVFSGDHFFIETAGIQFVHMLIRELCQFGGDAR